MADMLATPEDLASLLQLDWDTLTDAQKGSLTMLVEIGTAVVQAEVRQRIVQVVDDAVTLLGTTASWLELPQRPVTEVKSVTVDGEPVAEGTGSGEYRRFGSRLWRDIGWATCWTEPSKVEVVYTHGYPDGDQGLQLARGATLAVIRDWAANPTAATSVRIDDYAETYSAMAARLETSTHLRAALQRQYARRAGLVRIS